jgi:hypothetical protein
MKTKSSLLILTAVLVLFSFCRKEKPEISKQELLTGRTWKVTAYTVYPAIEIDESGTYATDLYEYAYFSDCLKNGIISFYADNSGKIDYPCEFSDQYFLWQFLENYTKFSYYGIYDILELSETTFIIRTSGDAYPIYTMTYKANL